MPYISHYIVVVVVVVVVVVIPVVVVVVAVVVAGAEGRGVLIRLQNKNGLEFIDSSTFQNMNMLDFIYL